MSIDVVFLCEGIKDDELCYGRPCDGRCKYTSDYSKAKNIEKDMYFIKVASNWKDECRIMEISEEELIEKLINKDKVVRKENLE